MLSSIRKKDATVRSAAFVEVAVPQPLREVPQRTATVNIGGGSIDLYEEMNLELLRTLVEMLRIC